ncbi:hypothetical protein ACFQZV_04340 [Microbacterium koreense]|uniref:Uncharacterized protein n=1 Tax=Microbacterium koreense TaxID=323761 RepID=A0ABW2ZPJ3_9MICO
MSTTGNEYEQPGVNYPDRDDSEDQGEPRKDGDPAEAALAAAGAHDAAEGADHHGQDGGRDTLTVGEAQAAMSGASEQDVPAMAQNNAPAADKIAGIVAQTRQDAADQPRERIVEVLSQRLDQAGVALTAEDIDELAGRVRADIP